MPSISIPRTGDNLTVTVSSLGVVTVPSTTKYFSGAEAWLSRDGVTSKRVLLLKIINATTMKVRPLPEDGSNVNTLNYAGGGDLSAFTGTVVKASKNFSTVGSGAFDSVLEATTGGLLGNLISVALVGDSPAAGGVTITRTGNAFVVHYESGVSTVGDVETAITALAGANDLVGVKTAGTGATVLTAPADNDTATNLAGGNQSRIDQPAQAVRIDLNNTKHTVS